jgi:hypothetical protein
MRSCTKQQKKRFMTRDSAQRFADRMLRLHGWKVRPYRCDVCLQYHLTTKTVEEYVTTLSDGALKRFARMLGEEIDADLRRWAAEQGREIKRQATQFMEEK